jgi:hypothetical protein
MSASVTHGNAGYLTYYRNYASSQWSPSKPGQANSAIVWSQPFKPQYSNVGALQFDTPDTKMTVIGNVFGSTTAASLGLPADLGTTGTGSGGTATSKTYIGGSGPSILLIAQNSVTWQTLWLTGNFDAVNQKTMWNASPLTASLPASTQNLPASLYLTKRPAWWPAGTPWPWVGPELSPKVATLPAHERGAAYDYYSASDPSCTLNCAAYCCSVGASCAL